MKNMFITSTEDGVITGTLVSKVSGKYLMQNELATHLVEATNAIGTKNNLYRIAYREYKRRTWMYDSPYGIQLLVLRALAVYEKKYGVTHYVPNFTSFEMNPYHPVSNPYVIINPDVDYDIIDEVSKALIGFNKEYMIDEEITGLPWTNPWGSVINSSIEWNTNHLVYPVYAFRVLAINNFRSPATLRDTRRNQRYLSSLLVDFAQTLTASIATCISEELGKLDIPNQGEVLDKYIDRIYFLINQAIKRVLGPQRYQEEEF